MSSTNKTPTIGLNQWIASDPVLRTDFNADNLAIDTAIAGKAPTSHASTATTYGVGTSVNYGHVKTLNSTNSTDTGSTGVAAAPAAVKAAYDLAASKLNTAISKTYAELTTMVTAKQLITGQTYLLTDYRTKYWQPVRNVIVDTGIVEPLILTAISSNRFSIEAFSPAYPEDMIYYDFEDKTCEDGTTPRTGFILRRHDLQREINIPHDWRFMKWARFKVDVSEIEVWSTGIEVTKGTFYITGTNISKALRTGTPASETDGSYWVMVVEDYETNYFLYNSAYGLTKKADEYKEYYTFDLNGTNNHNNVYITNIVINGGGGDTKPELPNNVWRYTTIYVRPYSIYASGLFLANTFGSNSWRNTFGSGFFANNSDIDCNRNTFGSFCNNNIFGKTCNLCTFGSVFSGNILGSNSYNNAFGSNCNGNVFSSNCHRLTFGTFCAENYFGSGCTGITFGSYCSGNILGASCSSNTFNSSCSGNIVASYFKGNHLKDAIASKNLSSYAELHNKTYNHTLFINSGNIVTATWHNASNVPQYLTIT